MNLINALHLMNNVKIEGSLIIVDKNNKNEVITITQEGDTFVATYSSGSPIKSESDSFPALMNRVNQFLTDSWEDSKPEIEEMDIND